MNQMPTVIARVLCGIALISAMGNAVADVEKTTNANLKRLSAGQQSQQKITQLATETQALLQTYRNTYREIDNLAAYNRQLEEQIANQQGLLKELEQSLVKVNAIERDIQPLMERMLAGLERLINADLPFYNQERLERLTHLKNNQTRADISVAEKFRQLLEAYEIEAEYGRSIDSYSAEVTIEGSARVVDLLRIGRIALLYQSKDGRQTGRWDQQLNQWVPLSQADYGDAIRQGLRMAKQQAAVGLLTIPIAEPIAVERVNHEVSQ